MIPANLEAVVSDPATSKLRALPTRLASVRTLSLIRWLKKFWRFRLVPSSRRFLALRLASSLCFYSFSTMPFGQKNGRTSLNNRLRFVRCTTLAQRIASRISDDQ